MKKNKEAPQTPKTHDLLYLAEKIGIELTDEQRISLDRVTKFNLEVITKEVLNYNEHTSEEIKEIQEWLKNLLMMK